jgi:hypothetical protein
MVDEVTDASPIAVVGLERDDPIIPIRKQIETIQSVCGNSIDIFDVTGRCALQIMQ